uniref:C2H2-type domain-containing protein n=1 Tax=Oryzias sinensis TaxID=183150 RepID=A0A8C8DEC5_9TELE
MSSEPQEGSVREQLSAGEGTIVQYEQELCRQRRLLDVIWKPQLQLHHIGLPQHWMTEEEDLCNQQRNFRVEQEEPEPLQIKEELEEPEPLQIKEEHEEPEPLQIKEEHEEPEPPQIKEEQEEPEPPQIQEEPGELCINQDEDPLDLKQETDTLMEIPTYEEDENSEADLNNQQSFNVTESQDEEGNQNEESTSATDEETESTSTTDEETESTSTTDEETDPQNRDQRKRRDRCVQSVDSSHMSAGQCDSDVKKNPKKTNLGEKCEQSPKEDRLSSIKSGKYSRIITNLSDYMGTGSDERCYICKECGKSFCKESLFKTHIRIHTKDKRFSCKECKKSFSHISTFKRHMRTHTGARPFSCKECN